LPTQNYMWNNFFNPRTVALIGATDRPGSVGFGIAMNLLAGPKKRKVFFVNPNRKKVLGKKSYPNINAIKERISLTIIAVPALIVPQIVRECARKKVGGAIIISAGFAEKGKKGEALQKEIKGIFKESGIPFVGPNCLGLIRPSSGLNASFAPAFPQRGNIAFLSQSGALIDSVIGVSLKESFGFSLLASLGNEADLGLSDFLKFLEKDKRTKVAALYLEGLKEGEGQKFIEAARAANKKISLVALKGGKTNKGNKAVYSHTGALAGEKEVYSAAFRKAGIFEVETISELLGLSSVLSDMPACRGNKVGIITNGGAIGVLLSDWLDYFGVKIKKYEDILGDASSQRYKEAMESALKNKNISGLIVCQSPQTMTDVEKNVNIAVGLQKRYKQKPILNLLAGGVFIEKGKEILRKNSLPCFQEPREAALAMKALVWRGNLLR